MAPSAPRPGLRGRAPGRLSGREATTPPGALPRLALTTGEPAGIGPELAVRLAGQAPGAALVVVGDPELLEATARDLGQPLTIDEYHPFETPHPSGSGHMLVSPVKLAAPARPGRPDPANARYVLEVLERAAGLCLDGALDGMVTAPVNKAVINDAGIPFSGHTEFLAKFCGGGPVVMMLTAGDLRVALVTTHLPLSAVPAAITAGRLEQTLRIVHEALVRDYRINAPRIAVLGLNPHAGEGGHLGREEIEVITPVIERLLAEGLDLAGPLPADTAFTPKALENADAVVAMYHDQGLPVLKHAGFGRAVNVTLGLPIVRTSVDHGTALDIAGRGVADPGSLRAALDAGIEIAANRARA